MILPEHGKTGLFLRIAIALGALGMVLFSFGVPREAKAIFTSPGRLITEGRIFSIACRDFDGDGRLDIAVSDFLNPARILYGDAGQAFKKILPLTSSPETAKTGHGIACGDFNGDGRLDIFLVYNGFSERLLLGDGKGGFADSGRAIGESAGSGTSVRANDVDGDGDLDVFVTYYQERPRLYLNDGKGQFTESGQAFEGGLEAGDLDGDGDTDVVCLKEDGTAALWLNEEGHFVLQERTSDIGKGVSRLYLVDVDGDGDLDLVALEGSAKSAIWINDGRGRFRKGEQALSSGTRVAAGDIDLDGRVDLVIGPDVWLNKGEGRFENVQTVALGMASCLELIDVDGDGDIDLLGAGFDRETGRSDLLLFTNTLRNR